MKKHIYLNCLILLILSLPTSHVFSGNPDRQGQSGAVELLFNPWAKSAGLHNMSTSSVFGVDALRLNIAGISRQQGTEIMLGSSRLFEGSDIKVNAIGFVKKGSGNGAFGISLTTVGFGDIPITTVQVPEGTGAFYSPSFFHIGVGYSYIYANKISVGLLLRAISESLPSVSAFGLALDAGIQYVTGERDNFKLGISLRNIGTPMSFNGQGLSYEVDAPNGDHKITLNVESEKFELPSQLNIGLSYDIYPEEDIMVRMLANFTSNSFSKDHLGTGIEMMYKNIIGFRVAYKHDLGSGDVDIENVYTGLAGGMTLNVPLKNIDNKVIGLDYAYRATNPFQGTHNLSLKMRI